MKLMILLQLFGREVVGGEKDRCGDDECGHDYIRIELKFWKVCPKACLI